ncbi:hypothetical protein I8751_03770 [Nostocaceae cyanobacterium CENA357]|uniref:Uncharacterized protein n=1 Tax=Atlanticothrix silvestris CENA357 TaxID=1725252 RepID=A0A8J7HFS9_9CYAN|nr:hypothetical protein [Atlanticothrix silvestris]MBH8551508.1 hypothetical protein [Atlanticothrix silvestris CENA357]
MRIILFQSSSFLLKDLNKCTARAITFCKNAYWLAIALGLRRYGIYATTTNDVELRTQSNEAQLAFIKETRFSYTINWQQLYTLNKDF